MAVAEAKELVQALAFAHFGVYKNLTLKTHEQKFLDLFDPEIEIPEEKKTEYKSSLSDGFPFDNLTRGRVGKTTYVKTYTQNKNGDVIGKDDDTVKIVYSVAKELYKKNILKVCEGVKKYYGLEYKIPEIIVLDEATSALDAETEKDFMNIVYEMKKNKTMIIITHRPSTLYKADRIYEFNNGKFLQQNIK